ncbi:MAG: amidophosphoribosyltransferase [Muribaculaceae bacterium]|nr:amidophosphoribosyltransferase [Muribaculaceae bacterium]
MELIKHECGIAMIRLLRPLSYYKEKYGSSFYGLNKLYLIMEKEHNRGQEGAGVGCVKLDAEPGQEYIFRERAQGSDAIRDLFASIGNQIKEARTEGADNSDNIPLPFEGEVYMGHLRYSTTGRSGIGYVHPFMRRNNWSSRNLLLCGNFNMTNVDEIFDSIVATGQHPRLYADTFLLLEQLGHALDRENERLFSIHQEAGLRGLDLSRAIARDLNVGNLLHRCAPTWDGGYVICGIVGNGDMWAMRDPNGIRPAFYYRNDEVIVVASERPVIQTAFDLQADDVHELMPGEAIIVDRDGSSKIERVLPEGRNERCSFERIYFSRGSDKDIYNERKQLGKNLVPQVLKAVNNDIDRTVLSFIPNTAEVAFFGLVEGFEEHLIVDKIEEINRLASIGALTDRNIHDVLRHRIRKEKVAIKDIKLRTFIAEGDTRKDLAAHVYDITYGSIREGDYLVAIDDSIVRGTTLRESILRILDRLHPGKLVIVSSSPQVRYPDCYGIDMSRMDEFIAFKAAMALLRERGMSYVIDTVYRKCKEQENLPKEEVRNYVKDIYAPFSDEEISAKIAEMLRPEEVTTPIEIVYQTVEAMHQAIPGHPGDWYFTGDYPTPGGTRIVNKAFINYYEGRRDAR